MNSISNIFKKFPFHFILIIIFFLSHGYSQYYGFIKFSDIFLYFLIVGGIAILSYLFFILLFKNQIKAGIFISILLIIYLFFGAFVDFFKTTPLTKPLSNYGYIVLFFLLLIIILFFIIKRSKRNFFRLNLYLTILFSFLIIIDLITISLFSSGVIKRKELNIRASFDEQLTNCDTCRKPDIYFIILDEYSGSGILKKWFKYDNTWFEGSLKNLGFRVIQNSRSNYPTTIMSLASMLNFSFLKYSPVVDFQAKHYQEIYALIGKNFVTNYLTNNRYTFYNYSFFDINGKPSLFFQRFFPSNINLILDKTFLERSKKDLFIDKKLGPIKLQWGIKTTEEAIAKYNSDILNSLLEVSRPGNTASKFVYEHLIMPHKPFLYDSIGKHVQVKTSTIPKPLQGKYYLNYLIYTNKVIINLMKQLQKNTNGNAIIMIMSDHGFRDFYPDPKIEDVCTNLNAIYLPDKRYDSFYDGVSNVNEFRILFNHLFNQKLPMLKDSIVNMPF